MILPVDQFWRNIWIVDDTLAVARAVDETTTDALDVAEILRSALVMSVSALDKFVHDAVRYELVQAWLGRRARGVGFPKFKVPLDRVDEAMALPRSVAWLEEEVTTQHELLAFQHPDRITDAVRLVCCQPLWPTVAALLRIDVQDAKRHLLLVVDRRNKIVHEFDMDPTTPGARWPITYDMVEAAVELIAIYGDAIYQVIDSDA